MHLPTSKTRPELCGSTFHRQANPLMNLTIYNKKEQLIEKSSIIYIKNTNHSNHSGIYSPNQHSSPNPFAPSIQTPYSYVHFRTKNKAVSIPHTFSTITDCSNFIQTPKNQGNKPHACILPLHQLFSCQISFWRQASVFSNGWTVCDPLVK